MRRSSTERLRRSEIGSMAYLDERILHAKYPNRANSLKTDTARYTGRIIAPKYRADPWATAADWLGNPLSVQAMLGGDHVFDPNSLEI